MPQNSDDNCFLQVQLSFNEEGELDGWDGEPILLDSTFKKVIEQGIEKSHTKKNTQY